MSGDDHNQADETLRRVWAVQIEPAATPYYDRLSDDLAVVAALEAVEEWDYAEDPHGYCHTRPVLLRLLEIATRGEVAS